ncbi:hypothetical protein [Deinococcus soli (ex Cha et al. 2016)]|uniref:Uncharacterized protein n=2 Tax=Deinococcus soli (ex Cha et al. 2016) TaxID=1309411 RepID=A0AAE3XBU5_9DEIO|nr:hypothetical protein [Deinococcus soli (ex Cha et al. 2016)]MDR6218910.1 hypothetical protein [Deinococcus soli (ex Cha et al. 2016)]MDR6328707.1 hypothetical protein [Deinococcus soli (ex Cha et al. 2016)]MDR6751806.1 hypothetical protein [Deinococcus soli (ex Cha et al. 2016)]
MAYNDLTRPMPPDPLRALLRAGSAVNTPKAVPRDTRHAFSPRRTWRKDRATGRRQRDLYGYWEHTRQSCRTRLHFDLSWSAYVTLGDLVCQRGRRGWRQPDGRVQYTLTWRGHNLTVIYDPALRGVVTLWRTGIDLPPDKPGLTRTQQVRAQHRTQGAP